jgi:hypothetical protein
MANTETKELATSPVFHDRWISHGDGLAKQQTFCEEVLSFSKN